MPSTTNFIYKYFFNAKKKKMCIQTPTVTDIPADFFIAFYANFLKKGGQVDVPSWIDIVKTKNSRKNSPYSSDWFFYKLASLARKFYIKKEKKFCSSKIAHNKNGKVLRFALQELEKLKIIEKNEKDNRIITQKAQRDMDNKAKKIYATWVQSKSC
ncbi:40S ribosomal protein S19 (nucleomorph) [Cryptomonas paramecium]|uniref:40S ribosomal protein S19 n=1 Tax=Cryptomonas paramaecium TaxID=2898 RepID=F2HIA9_9CRYP|nr:40S ribosomal protein S19 [Cryptomonas paramecium]AEA39033.1 40S ribosomal protein S19 [Cryptomonas paramecium]